ncbi:MAG: Tat pathway signal protein [Rhodobacteraceae bacterium]|nr:Tat pathway signal protein [Paracoccaceae bacterium]
MSDPSQKNRAAITRRTLLATGVAAAGARFVPRIAAKRGRWIVTMAYDKAAGALRVVERLVH